MSGAFISHVEEDTAVALELAAGLEAAGFSTWYYERDSVPGPSYLSQALIAIEQAAAVIVIFSRPALESWQVDKEIVEAHAGNKAFLPLLWGITHAELRSRRPAWVMAMGAAASLGIPSEGVAAILPRVVAGLKELGAAPEMPALAEAARPAPAPPVSPIRQPAQRRRWLQVPRASRRAVAPWMGGLGGLVLVVGVLVWRLHGAPPEGHPAAPPTPGAAFPSDTASQVAGPVRAPLPGAPNCRLFPPSNPWNQDISALPVAANSAQLIRSIGLDRPLHADFGAGAGNGMPFGVVNGRQAKVVVQFSPDAVDESDRGPYPIPPNPPIEADGGGHILLVDADNCILYELYGAQHATSGWHAYSGAIWDLHYNTLRPDGWTSADAAGLPILPALVRYDEVAAGVIAHALRFTVRYSRAAHLYPARHDAGQGGNDPSLPPMGLRVRLKASVDIGNFSPQAQVILTALKHYGMILADNGAPWFISGVPDPRWNDDDLHQLHRITGANLEVVDTSRLAAGP